jgi:hypothetical protein
LATGALADATVYLGELMNHGGVQKRVPRFRAIPLALAGAVVLLLGGSALASAESQPAVPACWAGTGQCGPFYLRGAGTPIAKETNGQSGLFELRAPGSVTSVNLEEVVATNDEGAKFYHHYRWILSGEKKVNDCETDEPRCTVEIDSGLSEWSPVEIELDSYPQQIYLLWEAGKCPLRGTAHPACAVKIHMRNKSFIPNRVFLKAGGRLSLCDEDNFRKEPFLVSAKKALPDLRVPARGCRSMTLSEPGTDQMFDGLRPRVHAEVIVIK